MFGIGPMEIVLILIFVLIFVGPKRLPELAQQFGRFLVQAKRVSSDVRSTVDEYMRTAERELLQEEREKLRSIINTDIKTRMDRELNNILKDDGSDQQVSPRAHVAADSAITDASESAPVNGAGKSNAGGEKHVEKSETYQPKAPDLARSTNWNTADGPQSEVQDPDLNERTTCTSPLISSSEN